MDPGIIVDTIDLLDEKYTLIIKEILTISKLEENIEDTPINISKSAIEKIVAAQFDLKLTNNVRSKFDLTDDNGRRYEVKCGTIAPVCTTSRNFKSKAGTITFTCSTLQILLASFATKSGGDKNQILLDIYKDIG